jgi:hypothetical protein
MLRKVGCLVLVILAAGSLATASAFAGDYCITEVGGNLGGVFVALNFAIPKAGHCANFLGFCETGCSPDNVTHGVACTASSGSHVSFGLTTYYLASNREFDWIRLDLPSSTGNGNVNYLNPAGTTNYKAKGALCAAKPIP